MQKYNYFLILTTFLLHNNVYNSILNNCIKLHLFICNSLHVFFYQKHSCFWFLTTPMNTDGDTLRLILRWALSTRFSLAERVGMHAVLAKLHWSFAHRRWRRGRKSERTHSRGHL